MNDFLRTLGAMTVAIGGSIILILVIAWIGRTIGWYGTPVPPAPPSQAMKDQIDRANRDFPDGRS